MRVLVTGAAGFIGTAVVERLTASGHEVRALTRADGDVRDPEAMRRAVDGMDGVCHLAALARVREARERADDYWSVNHGGTAAVVAAAIAEARRTDRPMRFVLASTGAVYGSPGLQPIPEDLPLSNTHNEYAETKMAAEDTVLKSAADGRFGAVVLRLFNVSGAVAGRTADPDALIPKAVAVAGGEVPALRVNGDGESVRDFVHVRDAASAFELALVHAVPDRRAVFNVGCTGASVLTIVRTVEEVSGRRVPVELGPRPPFEARTLLADTRRIRAELGWQPQHSDLRTIISDAWNANA